VFGPGEEWNERIGFNQGRREGGDVCVGTAINDEEMESESGTNNEGVHPETKKEGADVK